LDKKIWLDITVEEIPKPVQPIQPLLSIKPVQPVVAETKPLVVESPKPVQPVQPVVTETKPLVVESPKPVAQTPKPVVEEKKEEPKSAELVQLLNMGFTDEVRLKQLLNKNKNDLLRTIQDLLE